MIIKLSGLNQIDEIMDIWLDTNKKAHPFIKPTRWNDVFQDVKNALPSSDIYFYEDEGNIKGFIGITDHRYIAGLFVADKFQSQGIGRALLEHCQKLYRRLDLDVFIENKRAVSFYKKCGFIISHEKLNTHFAHEEYHMIWPPSALD